MNPESEGSRDSSGGSRKEALALGRNWKIKAEHKGRGAAGGDSVSQEGFQMSGNGFVEKQLVFHNNADAQRQSHNEGWTCNSARWPWPVEYPWQTGCPGTRPGTPPSTGLGISRTMAPNLGKKARNPSSSAPKTPTRLEATPVSSNTAIVLLYVVLGTVPASPAIRLPSPSEYRHPCTRS